MAHPPDAEDDQQAELPEAELRAAARTLAVMIECYLERQPMRKPQAEGIDHDQENCMRVVASRLKRAALRQRQHARRVATVALRDALTDIVCLRLAETWTKDDVVPETGKFFPIDKNGALRIGAALPDNQEGGQKSQCPQRCWTPGTARREDDSAKCLHRTRSSSSHPSRLPDRR